MKTFLGWVGLIALAAAGQYLMLSYQFFLGLLLFETAGVGLFLLFYPQFKPEDGSVIEKPFHWDVVWIPFILISVFSLICFCALTIVYLMGNFADSGNKIDYQILLYVWLGYISLILLTCCKSLYQFLCGMSYQEWIIPGFLLLYCLSLGLFHLTSVPYTVHGDEGMVGLYARKILNGEITTFFSTSWYALPQFFFWIPSTGMVLFGDSLFGLRMSSVLVGMLTVIPFYFLCRSLWGTTAALMASLMFLSNHWFLHLTHSGVSYIQAVWFALAVYCLLHFMNKRRSTAIAMLGGIVMGLGLMSYQANHLLPILWAASQLWLLVIRQAGWKWVLVSISIPFIVAAVVISPMLLHQMSRNAEQEMFKNRAESVVIWTETNWKHLDGSYKANGNGSLIIREQLKRALFSPLVYADSSIQYNGQKPMLDFVSASLWAVSAALALFLVWKTEWSLPLLWIVSILLTGGAFTVDAPFFPRLSGSTALYFVLIAGVFSTVFRALDEKPYWQYAAYGLSGLLALTSVCLNLNHYFGTFANEISMRNIHARQTRLGYFLQEHSGQPVLFFPGPHTSTQSGTCLLLAPNHHATDIHSLPEHIAQLDTIIILDPSHIRYRQQAVEIMPGAKEQELLMPNGELAFYWYSR